jgi:hypothetical protein
VGLIVIRPLANIRGMNRKRIHGALLLAAASLLAVGAYAQSPSPPSKANVADKDNKAAKETKEAIEAKAKSADDRAGRKAKEHESQREKLAATLKGPMNDSVRQELRRHAERLARLERIKALAHTDKDNDTVEKTMKLVAKENERHEKWMNKSVSPLTAPSSVEAKDGGK